MVNTLYVYVLHFYVFLLSLIPFIIQYVQVNLNTLKVTIYSVEERLSVNNDLKAVTAYTMHIFECGFEYSHHCYEVPSYL